MTGREPAGDRPGPAGSVAAAGQARATRIVLAALLMALVLTVGAALLPSAGAGLAADWLRVMAAIAAITVGALALPV
jgi:hypothetical protein